MTDYHQIIADLFSKASKLSADDVLPLIEFPGGENQGDRAIPVFRFSKSEKKSPQDLAKAWTEVINQQKLPPEISKVEASGGYINFYFEIEPFAKDILHQIYKHPDMFGQGPQINRSQVVVVEFSSPNIAKPFSIGHLRSTNLGASFARIFDYRGYNVVRINHLGDWGTQFGKLIVAFRRWGSPNDLDENPIQALFKLYVKFHDEESKDSTLGTKLAKPFPNSNAKTRKSPNFGNRLKHLPSVNWKVYIQNLASASITIGAKVFMFRTWKS